MPTFSIGPIADVAAVAAPSGVALYCSDLASGPNTDTAIATGAQGAAPSGYSDGCFVSLFGHGFGATRGTGTVTLNGVEVASYEAWGENNARTGRHDMIVVQLGSSTSTGNFVVTNDAGEQSNGIPFTIDNTRDIREVDSETLLDDALTEIASDSSADDDITYIRAGTYGDQHGSTGWGDGNIGLGRDDYNNLAFIGYPGENVTLDDSGTAVGQVRFDDSSGGSNGITVSNLIIDGSEWTCRCGGNVTSTSDVRIVNCDHTTSTNFLASGIINPAGDNNLVAVNYCHDLFTGAAVNNMNHVIYLQESNDGDDLPTTNTTVAWNYIYNIRTGSVIQWHTDNANGAWTSNECHSNLIQVGPDGTCRGVVNGEMGAGSQLRIYNNICDVDGQDFTAVIYGANERTDPGPSHTLDMWNNLIITRGSPTTSAMYANYFNENATGIMKNNIAISDGGAVSYVSFDDGDVSISQFDIDGNCYFGNGNGPTEDANAVNSDPTLVDPDNATWANRDYQLDTGNPCENAGSTDTLPLTVEFDHFGNERDQGSNIDIGPHEYG